ncbi:MAG: Crp/Fnr family transcriptional regulator [Dehalococcoidia bacterium]|nr:MAG: Crp/Fnr family transcriptional regulator [Dehalococcoidia bacterium]
MATKLDFLKASPFFAGFSTANLEALSQRVFEKKLARGEMALNEGAYAGALYFVAEGVVKLFKTSLEGKEQIISLMRPGESFNDVPMFDRGPAPVNAQALGAVLLYGLQREDLDIMLKQYPELSQNVIRILAQRIRYLITLVEDLSFRSVVSRVAKILLKNLGGQASPGPRLTQRDMAAMAGTAREVVSRSLKYLEDEKLIEIRRHQIAIRNKKGLEQVVEPGF